MVKTNWVVACVAAFTTGSLAQLPPALDQPREPIGEPRIEFKTLEHDFGTINDQEEHEFKFVFKNTGTATLIVRNALGGWRSEPRAMSTGLERHDFAPEEQGFILMRLNPHGKRGAISQILSLECNDPRYVNHRRFSNDSQPAPSTPLLVLPPQPKFNDGVPQVVFENLKHDFGVVSDQEDLNFKFAFKNAGSGTLVFKPKGKDVHTGHGFGQPRSLSGQPQLEFAPGEQGYIEVMFNPRRKRGCIEERHSVYTNDPRYK